MSKVRAVWITAFPDDKVLALEKKESNSVTMPPVLFIVQVFHATIAGYTVTYASHEEGAEVYFRACENRERLTHLLLISKKIRFQKGIWLF